jgi:hypothetical protein
MRHKAISLAIAILPFFLLLGCAEKKPPVVRHEPPKIQENVVFRPTFHMSDNPDIKGYVGFVGAVTKGQNYFFTPLHTFGPKNNVYYQLTPDTITRVLEGATLYSMDNKKSLSKAGKSVLLIGHSTTSEGNCAADVVALEMLPNAPLLPLATSDARANTQVWLYGNHLHSAIVRSIEPEALTAVLESNKTPIDLKKRNGTPLVNRFGEVVGMLNTYVKDGDETVLLVTPVSAMRLLLEANAKIKADMPRNQNMFDTSL